MKRYVQEITGTGPKYLLAQEPGANPAHLPYWVVESASGGVSNLSKSQYRECDPPNIIEQDLLKDNIREAMRQSARDAWDIAIKWLAEHPNRWRLSEETNKFIADTTETYKRFREKI